MTYLNDATAYSYPVETYEMDEPYLQLEPSLEIESRFYERESAAPLEINLFPDFRNTLSNTSSHCTSCA